MKYFIYTLLFSLFINFSLYADNSTLETKQILLVTRILKNSKSEKMKQVWPGFNLCSKPFFITFHNGHIYAFNIKMHEGQWKRTEIEGMEIFYTDKDQWGITAAPMQFNFEIQGQEAFIFRLDMMTDPAFLPYFVMVHERFHVYQIDHFASEQNFESLEGGADYPEITNTENLALMQLEELVLLDFMKALLDGSSNEANQLLKTYISIHQKRQKLLQPNSITIEDRQQMVEGLADYASAKNLDVFGYFGEKMGHKHILQTMKNYTEEENISERAQKWRHYGVGASLAYALDFLQVPNWKKAIERNISLQSLVESRVSVSPNEALSLFQTASDRYNYPALIKDTKEKIESHQKMLQSHQDKFQKLPGIVINIQTPPDSGLSAGGYSKGVFSLTDGSMFSVEDTSKTSSADNRWILELRSMPYIFQTNDGFRRFKIQKDTLEVLVDGKVCRLEEMRGIPFNQLTLKTSSCSFKSTQNKGYISLENGELNITYL